MNYGPLIFLGVFASIVMSWWTLVFMPQLQVGSQQPKPVEGSSTLYPAGRPGLAAQGAQVYVSAGCVYCHSQQVHQKGYTFDVLLTGPGTNRSEAAKALTRIRPDLNVGAALQLLDSASEQSPKELLQNVRKKQADAAQQALTDAGDAKAAVLFIPLGPDMRRGWGPRLTVAQDFVGDYPVQVGHSRLGPDLANYGLRAPDTDTMLRRLYSPRSVEKASIMPAHRYLFEKRKIGRQPSPDALKLTGEFAPPNGYEIVPRPEALLLVEYLRSLRADAPLFEAPITLMPQAPAPADTNAPAATNAADATPKQ